MDGYGNDVTASDSDPGTGSNVAGAIADIFRSGITAYVDSQAIQHGYQINDPRYYQGGYPAGVTVPYYTSPAGAGVSVRAGGNPMVLLLIGAVVVVMLLRKG